MQYMRIFSRYKHREENSNVYIYFLKTDDYEVMFESKNFNLDNSLTREKISCIIKSCQQIGAIYVLMGCLFLCPYSWQTN